MIIGDRVEIGACTTIDRGALDNTKLSVMGIIIDNQCQIAHNVIIGDNTAVAISVIMAKPENWALLYDWWSKCYPMVTWKFVIKVTVTGMGMCYASITEPGVYSSGIPFTTE